MKFENIDILFETNKFFTYRVHFFFECDSQFFENKFFKTYEEALNGAREKLKNIYYNFYTEKIRKAMVLDLKHLEIYFENDFKTVVRINIFDCILKFHED